MFLANVLSKIVTIMEVINKRIIHQLAINSAKYWTRDGYMCRNCFHCHSLQSSVRLTSSAASCPSSPHHSHGTHKLSNEGDSTQQHQTSGNDPLCLVESFDAPNHYQAIPKTGSSQGLLPTGSQLSCGNRHRTLDRKLSNNLVAFSMKLPLHCKLLSARSLPDIHQARGFFNLSEDKLKEYSERRLLGYSMQQMYDVVAGVENYKEFVPYCKKSDVVQRRKGFLKAELEVGFPPISESYVSSVSLAPPHMIRAVCTQGKLFNHLLTVWRFSPGLPDKLNTCTLDFNIGFEFRSSLHSRMAHMFFDEMVRQNVTSFLKEAQRRYGSESIRTQRPTVLHVSS